MFAISRKVATLRMLLFGIIIAAVVSIVGVLTIRNKTAVNAEPSATMIDGEKVTLTYSDNPEDRIPYNIDYSTHLYLINGQRAFCAQPSLNPAQSGSKFSANLINDSVVVNRLKLMMYIYFYNDSALRYILDDLYYFEGRPDWQNQYAFTHFIIALIYQGSFDGRTIGTTESWQRDIMSAAIGKLDNYINNNSDVWLRAQNYDVFAIRPGEALQDIVWIEEAPKRGNLKFVKRNATPDNPEPMANVAFKLSHMNENLEEIEYHVLVSNEDGVVDTSLINHSINTNMFDERYSDGGVITYEDYGTWFSIENGQTVAVNDSLGALPFGTYIIQELRCDGNLFCYGILDQQKTFTLDYNHRNIDLGNWDNECAEFSIDTEALDKTDEDNYVEEGEVTIVDTIRFCAKPGLEFRIEGILMDKETGEPLLVDGNPITGLLEKVSTQNADGCDIKKMEFTFDATGLGGKELVVFESLYYDGEQDPLAVHDDINAEKQTITVLKLKTNAMNKETGEKTLPYGEDVVIRDVVTYCLKPGTEYTIEGTLMNKATKEVVTIDGEPVTQTVTFTPDEACGEFDMDYELNTEDLAGADLVIFENLYVDGELVVEHKDFDNGCETVTVEIPTPDTGYITKEVKSGSSEVNNTVLYSVAIIAITLGGYVTKRVMARRRW